MGEMKPLSEEDAELIRKSPELLLKVRGRRAELELESGEMFERWAVFSKVYGAAEGEYWLSGVKLDGHTLTGEILDETGKVTGRLEMAFEGVSSELRVFRPAESLGGKPWERLFWLAWDMTEAREAGAEFGGGVELETILGELRELSTLAASRAGEGRRKSAFPILKGCAVDLGYKELAKLFTRAEGKKAVNKLLLKLNAYKYEPLWREICGRIAFWKGLKSRPEAYCAPEELYAARERVSGLLMERGYAGEYPDFVRTGPIRGVHLANAYGQTYFVGPEKRAEFHIHCVERYDGDGIHTDYICGTRILKRGEEAGDIWLCLFDGGGYRLAGAVRAVDGEPELTVNIAVKRAELAALTPRELEAAGDRRTGRRGWGLILAMSSVMGLMFGAVLTLAAAVGTAALGLALSGKIMPLLGSVPWWAVFGLSAALFAGAMIAVMAGLGRK